MHKLGGYCIAFDQGTGNAIDPDFSAPLVRLYDRFLAETNTNQKDADKSYVVVYDARLNELLRCEYFPPTTEGRLEALDYYRQQTKQLNDVRYDVLVLNSKSSATLKVTHPRYFPE